MNTDTESCAKRLLALIAETRDYNSPALPSKLLEDATNIMGELVYLVGPLMDLETAYRDEVKLLMESDTSVAKAETMAKAGVNYKEWKKVQMVYELGEESIRLLKKFASLAQEEYKNTR